MSINKSDTILVTGGTGFLGSYILRYLVKQGYTNIRALKRKTSRLALVEGIESKINWVETDILQLANLEEAFEGVDYVIHSAAIISLDPKFRDKMYDTNINGTQNIVNLCLHHKVKKLVHVSSIAAIGRDRKTKLISEETEWVDGEVNTHYSITKFKSELEVWRAASEGLNMAIINPSLIFGGGYWKYGTPAIFDRVYKGIPFYPVGINGMCDVRDVALSSIMLLESDICNERFIISNENLSFKDLFKIMGEALDCKYPTKPFTKFWREIAWRVEWLHCLITRKERLITRESLITSAANSSYDNTKSINILGMKYRDMRSSLIEIAALYKSSKSDYGVLEL